MKATLNKEQLHHSIRQLAFRYAEARIDDADNRNIASMLESSTSAEQLLQRLCFSAVAYLKTALRKYITTSADDGTDTLAQNSSWEFDVKSTKVDGESMANLLHWFVVKYALWQWVLMYSPVEAAALKGEVDDMEDELLSALKKSSMPMKKHRPNPEDFTSEITITYEGE